MSILKKGFFVMALSAVLAFGISSIAYGAETNQITVNGTGIVNVEPDIAKISVSIEATDKTAERAQNQVSKLATNLINEMEKMGVPKEKIITLYSSVTPNYRYDDATGKRNVDGYRAYTSLQITVKDVDNVGVYVDGALKAGATGLDGVSFTLEDPSMYYNQALQVAVKNANTSANAIATAYGKALGGVSAVTENSSMAIYESAKMATEELMMSDAGGSTRSNETKIQHDKVQVSARISATYHF